MPAKNAVKEYKPKSIYHVYNRGAGRQNIFLDEDDYKTFLGYLKFYLTLTNYQDSSLKISPSRVLRNYAEEIDLLAYCLMPNHFHLLLYQDRIDSINYFLRSLATKYSMYFNRKNARTGHLFEGIYKAVLVESDKQLLYLSKYIHRNPIKLLPTGMILEGYKFSSYGNYLGLFKQRWVKTDRVMNLFSKSKLIPSYKSFVEKDNDEKMGIIKETGLDTNL